MIATDCPEGRPHGRNKRIRVTTLVVRREVKVRKPVRLGLWIEFLLKVDEINTRLLSRAMAKRLLRELEKQNAKWN